MNEKKDRFIMLVVVLLIICLFASLSLGLLYSTTKEKIADEVRKAKEAALKLVFPEADEKGFERIETDVVVEGEKYAHYKVYDKPLEDEAKQLLGYAFEGKAKGYSSTIVLTVGVDRNVGIIKGIKITSQQETPGLGANCEEVKAEGTLWDVLFGKKPRKTTAPEPWFQKQFRGKRIDSLVKTDKTYENIDALTGATITTNAVVDATLNGIRRFENAMSSVGEEESK